jgi:hypothetical protein
VLGFFQVLCHSLCLWGKGRLLFLSTLFRGKFKGNYRSGFSFIFYSQILIYIVKLVGNRSIFPPLPSQEAYYHTTIMALFRVVCAQTFFSNFSASLARYCFSYCFEHLVFSLVVLAHLHLVQFLIYSILCYYSLAFPLTIYFILLLFCFSVFIEHFMIYFLLLFIHYFVS